MQQAPISPDGVMQIQLQEMPSPEMKAPRRPRQKRPYDEELERQIRLLLISSYDPVEVKTTWHCSQCGFSSKLQYTVKQHIETHITTIVHQCALCPKILKTRNALRAHMNQKHESKPRQSLVESPPWMGGGGGGSQSSNFSAPVQVRQVGFFKREWQPFELTTFTRHHVMPYPIMFTAHCCGQVLMHFAFVLFCLLFDPFGKQDAKLYN